MSTLRLGWWMAARSWRSSMARTTSMALGMALAAFMAAALLSLPAVFEGKNDRTRLTTVSSGTPALTLGTVIDEQLPAGALRRVVTNGQGPAPLGLAVIPQPGEVAMSPALASLVRRDASVRGRFPQRLVGIVAEPGLVEPGQLLAYIGAEPDGRFQAITFGALDAPLVTGTREVTVVMVAFTLFLLLPSGAFLATSSRLSARTRHQRLSSLRLLGLSRRAVRLVNAMETAVVGGLGGLIGVVAWAVTEPLVARRGVGGFRWFASDAPLEPTRALLIGIVAAVAAAAVATVTASDAIDRPLSARVDGAETVRVGWRALVMALGVAMLVACAVRNAFDDTSLLLLVGGAFCAAIGTTLATPVVSRVVGFALGSRGGATRLLVSRRLIHEPSVAGRVLSGVLLATFAVGAGQGVIGAVHDSRLLDTPGQTRQITTALSSRELDDLPGVEVAIGQVRLDNGMLAWVATCDQLATLLAQSLPGCVDGEPLELVGTNQQSQTRMPALQVDVRLASKG